LLLSCSMDRQHSIHELSHATEHQLKYTLLDLFFLPIMADKNSRHARILRTCKSCNTLWATTGLEGIEEDEKKRRSYRSRSDLQGRKSKLVIESSCLRHEIGCPSDTNYWLRHGWSGVPFRGLELSQKYRVSSAHALRCTPSLLPLHSLGSKSGW
jgi:hypothetical protein